MPFGLWTRVGLRKHALGQVHTGATCRIPLNRHAATMRPFYSAPQCSHCKRCTSDSNSVRPSVCHTPSQYWMSSKMCPSETDTTNVTCLWWQESTQLIMFTVQHLTPLKNNGLPHEKTRGFYCHMIQVSSKSTQGSKTTYATTACRNAWFRCRQNFVCNLLIIFIHHCTNW